MHDKYDVEMDGGNDEPTLIINPKCKERLGISNDGEGLDMCLSYAYSINKARNSNIIFYYISLQSCS
jgi:hypothetical protein